MREKIFLIPLIGVLLLVMAGAGPPDAAAELQQAETLFKNGQYEQAEQIYQQILADQPGTDDALAAEKNLTCLYIATDNQQQAQAALAKLLDDFADNEKLPGTIHRISEQSQKSARADKAILLYEHLMATRPEQAVWLQMGVAISNVLLEDQTAAWAAAEKLLDDFSADQRCAEAVGQMAWCYRNLKQYENARSFYQHVVDTWPDNERAIFSQRGIVLTSIALKDYANAESNIETLLARYSRNEHIAEVVTKIAYVYRDMEEHEKARELYQYVVDNCPDSKEAIWSQRGAALCSIALGDEEASETAIENLLLRFSSHVDIADVVHDVAGCCHKYERYDKAARLYQYALDHWPEIEQILWARAGMAKLDIVHGDDGAAKTAIDNLVGEYNDHPGLPKAVFGIGAQYWELAFRHENQGFGAEARADFTRAVALWETIPIELPKSPMIAEAYYFSAQCYQRLGQYEKAIELYQKVADNFPDFRLAWNAQFAVVKIYKWLLNTDRISNPEGYAAITVAYECILERFPYCPAAENARTWMRLYATPREGESK